MAAFSTQCSGINCTVLLKLSAAVFSTLKLQHSKVISGSHHVDQQSNDGGPCTGTGYNVQVVGQVELIAITDVAQCGPTSLSWSCIPWNNSILSDINADGVHRGEVGHL